MNLSQADVEPYEYSYEYWDQAEPTSRPKE